MKIIKIFIFLILLTIKDIRCVFLEVVNKLSPKEIVEIHTINKNFSKDNNNAILYSKSAFIGEVSLKSNISYFIIKENQNDFSEEQTLSLKEAMKNPFKEKGISVIEISKNILGKPSFKTIFVSPYKILGIKEKASPEQVLGLKDKFTKDELEDKYRKLVRVWNPNDTNNPKMKVEIALVLSIIDDAYNKLKRN